MTLDACEQRQRPDSEALDLEVDHAFAVLFDGEPPEGDARPVDLVGERDREWHVTVLVRRESRDAQQDLARDVGTHPR